jgi:CheY-like chemotaxis protein
MVLKAHYRLRGSAMKILLVEDTPDARELLRMLLEMDHHTVYEATNGIEAVEAVPQCRPELILMDLRMPIMDGYEATREIRRLRLGRQIPIVAITADLNSVACRRALDAGCDRCEAKPYDMPHLRTILESTKRAA